MGAHEIAVELLEDLKPLYQYRHGRWLYRDGSGWRYANVPRLLIWQAMVARRRAGVVPSPVLADEVQRWLEWAFEKRGYARETVVVR
ncbi:MAG: hypothetical protein K8I30_20040 [Anaerolineae bacterium]|nr:hypothetical protein [Anaerolineae bacterium]